MRGGVRLGRGPGVDTAGNLAITTCNSEVYLAELRISVVSQAPVHMHKVHFVGEPELTSAAPPASVAAPAAGALERRPRRPG